MSRSRHLARTLTASSLIVSMLGLSACNNNSNSSAASASAASATQPAATPVAYTPPSADQLYQMVAPIALFPDKLVALVLAGATYPDQVTAANNWLSQNPSLSGQALANAVDGQPWDPSIKALTAFPAVLSQMASNISWTTALGQAYYNDPTDVMNAIQVMRQRAQASGNLRSGSQMQVTQVAQAAPSDQDQAQYVVPPPPQAIEIESAQPDAVYVPQYDPDQAYGQPMQAYPEYVYQPPSNTGAKVVAGALAFGAAVAVGTAVMGHHDWGWHSWGVNWGDRHDDRDRNRANAPQRPAVEYNHAAYRSQSPTLANRPNQPRNAADHAAMEQHGGPAPGEMPREQAMQQPGTAPMSMPHFGADATHPGARPDQGQQSHMSGAAMAGAAVAGTAAVAAGAALLMSRHHGAGQAQHAAAPGQPAPAATPQAQAQARQAHMPQAGAAQPAPQAQPRHERMQQLTTGAPPQPHPAAAAPQARPAAAAQARPAPQPSAMPRPMAAQPRPAVQTPRPAAPAPRPAAPAPRPVMAPHPVAPPPRPAAPAPRPAAPAAHPANAHQQQRPTGDNR